MKLLLNNMAMSSLGMIIGNKIVRLHKEECMEGMMVVPITKLMIHIKIGMNLTQETTLRSYLYSRTCSFNKISTTKKR